MLYPDQVIPFLMHDQVWVREHALHYFSRANDQGSLTADHLWQAIDRLGPGEASQRFVTELAGVRQTPASLDRLFCAIESADSKLSDYHLQRALNDIDFQFLVEHQSRVFAMSGLSPEVRTNLKERLRLADVPAERCWLQLMQIGRNRNADTEESGRKDTDRLIEAISRNPAGIVDRAMKMLTDPGFASTWEEIFAVQLLGLIKHEPAVAPLVQKLLIDEDILREETNIALARIGTVEVVRQIEAFYPGKEWHVRLYSNGCFSHIKRPESEAVILQLLEIESDATLRQNMLMDLCELGSLAGLEQSRKMIQSEEADADNVYLRKMLIAVATMHGITLEEDAEWRPLVEAQDAKFRKVMALDDAQLHCALEQDWSKKQSHLSADAISKKERDAPVVYAEPKLGRNDPCPCGSGKKYKKCCMS